MSNFYKNPNRIKSNYQIHVEGKSKDEQARQRVTFLMKTPINKLIKSRIYDNFVKESISENGRAWWFFTNVSVHNRKEPWLWQFKGGKDCE